MRRMRRTTKTRTTARTHKTPTHVSWHHRLSMNKELTGETACARAPVRNDDETLKIFSGARFLFPSPNGVYLVNQLFDRSDHPEIAPLSLSLSFYLLTTTTTTIIMATVKQRFVCTLPRLVGLVRDCDNRGGQDSSGRTRIQLCREHVVIVLYVHCSILECSVFLNYNFFKLVSI
jgi:hypothetical protein